MIVIKNKESKWQILSMTNTNKQNKTTSNKNRKKLWFNLMCNKKNKRRRRTILCRYCYKN